MKPIRILLAITLATSVTFGTAACASTDTNASPTSTLDSNKVLPILDAWQQVANKSSTQMLETGLVEEYKYSKETYKFVLDPMAEGDSNAGMLKQPGDEYTLVPDTTYFLVILASEFVTQAYTIEYEGTPTPNNFTVRVANLQQVEPPMYIDVVDGLMTTVRGGEGDSAFTGTIKYQLTDADREVVAKAVALG